MIRFNIIGTGFLDFEEHGNLAFTAQNQWFRFADVSMSRSVEFKIPATERNKKMLGYGEDVNNYGDMLRVNHECQMVYDGGAMMGTLSVTAYEGNAFKCVFFLKSAPWIDRLQELKLSDCPTSFTKGVPWTAVATVEDADAADPTQECLIINYENGISGYAPNWQLVPSVNVKAFIEDILGNLGVPFSGVLDDSFWMISGSMKGGDTDFVTFGATATNNVTISQSQGYFTLENITVEWARSNVFGMLVGGGSVSTQGYKATQDVEVTFGASVAKPLFLIKWDSRLGRCEVLGGSNVGGLAAGVNPLDGRTVSVKKGDIIFFAKNSIIDVDTNGTYYGWKDIAYPMSETCTVTRSNDLTFGETWQLYNNMPDMTVFEFLKSIALATGLELSISPDGVVLGNAVYGKKFVQVENVVSIDSVERIVESWGNDTISALTNFDSEEYVTEPLVTRYDINNQQRQSEAVHTSKFSEGNLGNTSNNVEVLDVSVEGGVYKFAAKKWTICRAVNGETYLQRIVLPNPVGYDDIAENSTCVKMKMATGEAAFFALEAETTFLWRGAAFVWTNANWSGGIMTLTLQRVSKPAVVVAPQPYDSKVEYLESDGSQWIDTGIVLQENDVVEIEAMFLNKSGDNFMMGTAGLTGEGGNWIEVYGNTTHYVRFGSTSSASQSGNASANMNVWRTYKIEKGKFYVDGVQKLTPNYASMPSRSLVIFGRNTATPNGGVVKIRSAKILRDGAPILDLSSVRAGSVGYMYDAVSDSILNNNGTFAYGADV